MYGRTNATIAVMTNAVGNYFWEETSEILGSAVNPKIVLTKTAGTNEWKIASDSLEVGLLSIRSLDGFKNNNSYFEYNEDTDKLYITVNGVGTYEVTKDYGFQVLYCSGNIGGTYSYIGKKRVFKEPYHYKIVTANASSAFPEQTTKIGDYYYTKAYMTIGNLTTAKSEDGYPLFSMGNKQGIVETNGYEYPLMYENKYFSNAGGSWAGGSGYYTDSTYHKTTTNEHALNGVKRCIIVMHIQLGCSISSSELSDQFYGGTVIYSYKKGVLEEISKIGFTGTYGNSSPYGSYGYTPQVTYNVSYNSNSDKIRIDTDCYTSYLNSSQYGSSGSNTAGIITYKILKS